MERWYWLRYLITSNKSTKLQRTNAKWHLPTEKPRHSSTQLPNSFRIQFDNTIFPTLFTNTSVAIYLILSIFKKLMVTTNKHSKLVWRSFRFWFFSVIFLIVQKQPSRHLPAQHHWRRSGTFIVNFEHIWQLVLVFLLLTF